MNHMMEIVKKIKLSGRRSDGGNAPLCAQENLAHKTAPPKSLRAQSSPMGHKPRTSRFKQPVEHKRFNSSKYGSGSCALPSRVKDVLFGTYGKQPFDRGRNGDDEVRLKICINRFDQVVYSLLLAKHSLLHKIFHVYVSEVCVVEDEPLPGRPPPLRDKKSHSPVCSAKEFKPKSITSTTTMRFFIKQASLTLAASGPDGSSVSNEILSFLRSSSTHELNAVFSKLVSVPLRQRWTKDHDLFENVFKAAFDGVDFLTNAEKVRIELNKWAEDHTNGLIKDLLPAGSVSSQTGCVFGNALYFKGAWEVPFDKSYTKDKEFQLLSGTSVSVPFMSSYKNQYIKAYDGFKVLRIPYRQGNDVDTNRSFPYRQVVDATNGSFSIIPKFKIAYGLDGQDLGLRSMALYHKACVEIDEEGAKAAAATFVVSCGCARYMEPPKRIDFVADHPFLFLIREDKTGTVLFVGQIKDPSNKSA
ncbi:hypothetical protein F2Q68_00014641 [Brassica cretica]|uniref:Serpin domain-containing protein n=1 Tax=Brassica cretica TaxID=69181 RepID=A0A8S9HV15_BRACR|nr:hypothetical protein F2Q68_00014641 [Brassica cretica]